MSKVTRFIGLDVHKDTVAIAMADADGSPAQSTAETANDWNALRRRLRRPGKFLLRHGRIFRDGKHWTKKHRAWIGRQKFSHEAQRRGPIAISRG